MSTSSNAGVGTFQPAEFDPATFDPSRFGLATEIVNKVGYERSVERFRTRGIALPTFAQMGNPSTIPESIHASLVGVDRNAADARNLYRVHWYNDLHGGLVDLPEHVVLPTELTGVPHHRSSLHLVTGSR